MEDITFGGFIPSNIRRAILLDCYQSGDPVNYFRALRDEVEKIEDECIDNDDFFNGNNWPKEET